MSEILFYIAQFPRCYSNHCLSYSIDLDQQCVTAMYLLYQRLIDINFYTPFSQHIIFLAKHPMLKLQTVVLAGVDMTQVDLVRVMPHVQYFRLSGRAVPRATSDCLRNVAAWMCLKCMRLEHCAVSMDCLSRICEVTTLEDLCCMSLTFEDADVNCMPKRSSLVRLRLLPHPQWYQQHYRSV